MSIVRELYGQYACPLARVVRGLPISWDPALVTTYREDFYGGAIWSPCSRFIAIAKSAQIEILDAATLERLNTFERPRAARCNLLSFSPDGRILTLLDEWGPTSWDLQTGCLVGASITAASTYIPFSKFSSSAYSVDGRVIAALDVPRDHHLTLISTYNLLSGTHTGSFRAPEGLIVNPIWTHGECLRFVTLKPGSITVWEVSFALRHTPATVQSFPAPDECTATRDGGFLFLPMLCRLAFTIQQTIFIWDAQDSRFLLKSELTPVPYTISPGTWMSFSSDGGFFACMIGPSEVHVWKKSPACYTIHQKFEPPFVSRALILSPDGGSIITAGESTIRLYHTRDQILSLPSVPAAKRIRFILAFSPNEASAAFTRRFENTVTVLDLRSGDLRLTIEAVLRIQCLGVTGRLVAVAGEGKVITWNLPVEGCVNARASIDDSVYATTLLDYSNLCLPIEPSISPDLTRVATLGYPTPSARLQIHDTASGRQLAGTELPDSPGWVALNECEVWWGDRKKHTKGWKIVEDQRSLTIKLETLETTACPPRVFFWQSRRGYEVTSDGWVLSPTQKRLLWLPHHWRSEEELRTWGGRFLGLGHGELPEVVILEFYE